MKLISKSICIGITDSLDEFIKYDVIFMHIFYNKTSTAKLMYSYDHIVSIDSINVLRLTYKDLDEKESLLSKIKRIIKFRF